MQQLLRIRSILFGITGIIPSDSDALIIDSLIYPNMENGIVIPNDRRKLIEIAEKYILKRFIIVQLRYNFRFVILNTSARQEAFAESNSKLYAVLARERSSVTGRFYRAIQLAGQRGNYGI